MTFRTMMPEGQTHTARTVLAMAKWSRIVFFWPAPCCTALTARRCALAASLLAFSSTL